MSEGDELPVVVLRNLEGNQPAQLNPIQALLQPSVPTVEMFWYLVWFGILGALVLKHVLGIPLPALVRRRKPSE